MNNLQIKNGNFWLGDCLELREMNDCKCKNSGPIRVGRNAKGLFLIVCQFCGCKSKTFSKLKDAISDWNSK